MVNLLALSISRYSGFFSDLIREGNYGLDAKSFLNLLIKGDGEASAILRNTNFNFKKIFYLIGFDNGVVIAAAKARLNKLPPFNQEARLSKKRESLVEKFWADQERQMHSTLIAVAGSDIDAKDASAFFEGISKGLKEPFVSESGNPICRLPKEHLYREMFTHAQAIEKLPTRKAVHAYLCKKLGAALVGDLDAFNKLCFRIGLKAGKQGRPKKRTREQ